MKIARLSLKRSLQVGGVLLLVLGAFFLGKIGHPSHPDSGKSGESAHSSDEKKPQTWTCSMHPQIKLPKEGKCPICFMDLIPLVDTHGDGHEEGPANRLVLSKNAQALAGIVTAPVVRRGVSSDISLPGKVAFDETRVETVSSRVAGRLDKLWVNLVGIGVKKGDHLAEVYSPELISLQQELVSAAKAVGDLPPSAGELVRSNAQQILSAAEEKLRLLGFSSAEVQQILQRRTLSDHMTIRVPQEGTVIERFVNEGDYVGLGTPLFRVADLRTVWVMLDAYESDLAWLRMGQKVEFTVEAFPGEVFRGSISLIDPVVDPTTRTTKVRVIAANTNLRLKPDMFVKARVKAPVAASGKSKNTLRGKWISPMHPQIVKDGPGFCDICGMALVPAESLGYTASGTGRTDPLIIPATAPLFTGERAVVYVEVTTEGSGSGYEGREVVLGPRVGEFYVVKSGLAEGEKVVANGAFRIDSELQIRAKPSMMSPGGAAPASGHGGHAEHGAPASAPSPAVENVKVSSEFAQDLGALLDGYFATGDGLAGDDLKAAKAAMDRMEKTRGLVRSGSGKAYAEWTAASKLLASALEHRGHVATIADARTAFEKVSEQVIKLHRYYGKNLKGERFVAFCPMAFDNKGAYWLQKNRDISNPYFGAAMLKCGEIR